ncbi:UDP-glucose 4-epimerase GalE [Candidatus Methylacidiphilum fumarolicum]|uniref:UDP-glucose 4-epimerase n=2 Tax=Candidatus Methylacidiphilum fumarolicum TaxID=591154 RepID=I0JYL8_METFB|nr:UDP-glucose 4-epimerase GalE [Candidatus Methylacidiphilum fumarolicum]MBW6415171.1 UDP-glucose 4-epimerase GalE [Candidatus Methylacidiphilum fumarolicum]TFE65952.1 UDP-glucose 4-epimerase GalE [Candidatus Methylacidiphilum fumarolicum]TFE72684.1 UDP-glucose 4-epimerase GalE [Candidatus Methylacidiphilum fumarolicum]TFE73151.1 UDP-glucose 4-epimerase GalE [Candidatus Methylacidiphilum fumarolicum]TFE77552.1 UDP-glucose 4-epimerase GalE [Candidatus Methylacidiphilum fumarolicum]
MKVLVTGGAGYIGSICVERLIDRGYQVIVLDNLSEGHIKAVESRALFIKGDIADRNLLLSIFMNEKPQAVIHFAAKALVAESMRDPSLYFQNNVAYGINLLDAMVAYGLKRIVFSSTCSIYGSVTKVPIDENFPANPENPYGESKFLFEKILEWYRKIHGISPVIFRYFNAAGATLYHGEHHRKETHLIPRILQAALGILSKVEIYGVDYPTADGSAIRDYIHVVDLVDAHIKALENPFEGVFNLGSAKGYSVLEVIEAARAITAMPIPAVVCSRRTGDPPILVANFRKAFETFGWKPNYDLNAIIQSAWSWHKSHPRGYE